MRQKLAYGLIAVLLGSVIFSYVKQCSPTPLPTPKPATQTTSASTAQPMGPKVEVPVFNADSAYHFVKKQVDFGPRIPNTPTHAKCAAWLVKTLQGYGLKVTEQKFQAKHYKGETFNAINIIGEYRPENPRRILLAAHWDSRFMADKDAQNQNKPIDGADDGGSGVGVLLEIARTLARTPADIGVDILLLDAEDQGNDGGEETTWCLGSQYWAENPHRGGYSPYHAVLLDLVGAKGAKFQKEGASMQVAPETVNKIWKIAADLGHSGLFVNNLGPGIVDDHLFIIRGASIPMIDIVSMPGNGEHLFGSHHHTHADNMSVIDKNVLKAVGQTMTTFIYSVYNGVI
ncbi:MAG: M28 family peptidase [Saprospiraceae bacterium]|nr:M28 family peptidase [Saprospiraceae bacterium]